MPALRWFLELRRAGDSRALIAAFGLLNVATLLVTLFAPGDPSYSGDQWAVQLSVLTLLILFLRRGSRIAWWISLFLTAPAVVIGVWVALFGSGGSFDVKALAVALLQAVAVSVLTAPALESSLGRHREKHVASSA